MCQKCGWEIWYRDIEKFIDEHVVVPAIEGELEHIKDSAEGNKHITPEQKKKAEYLLRKAGA
ncbi:MAG: hypothetical protein WC683_03900 [bacterium]